MVGVLSQAMGADAGEGEKRHGHGVAAGMGAYVIAKYGMAGMLLACRLSCLASVNILITWAFHQSTETRMLQVFDERFLALQREKQEFTTPQHVASLIVDEALAP